MLHVLKVVSFYMYMYLSLFSSTGLWVPNIPDIVGAELTEVREAIIVTLYCIYILYIIMYMYVTY